MDQKPPSQTTAVRRSTRSKASCAPTQKAATPKATTSMPTSSKKRKFNQITKDDSSQTVDDQKIPNADRQKSKKCRKLNGGLTSHRNSDTTPVPINTNTSDTEETKDCSKSASDTSNDSDKLTDLHLKKLLDSYKPQTVHTKLHNLTGYRPIVAFEIVSQIRAGTRDAKDQDQMICPICRCDLFDDADIDPKRTFSSSDLDKLVSDQTFDSVVLMGKCKDHPFHVECLQMQLGPKDFLDCSICMVTYGVKTGDMPRGTMSWNLESFSCDGQPSLVKTWVIQYRFKSGKNPATGHSFGGDGRTAYLPDTAEGREVLLLLVNSFKRRLTFTVGFSVVRGRDNCIVWNGIHHKTNTHGGSSRYGYPDVTYFNRVKQELALKGLVLSEDPKQNETNIQEVVSQQGSILSV